MSHDDSARLVTAIMRGGTVPPGVYTLQSPAVLTNLANVTAIGYGVRIVAAPNMTTASADGDMLRLIRARNVRLIGFSFDGNRTARGGFAGDPQSIRLNWSNDVTLRDCSFTGDVCDSVFCWGGFNPTTADLACQRIVIDSCKFSDCGRNGVSFVGANWSSVINCDFADLTTSEPMAAVDVEANTGDPEGINHHLTVANSRVRNVGRAVMVVKTASPCGVVIMGNQIDGTKYDAIFNEGSNTLIVGNNASNCGLAGISCPSGTMAQVGNNATVYQGN